MCIVRARREKGEGRGARECEGVRGKASGGGGRESEWAWWAWWACMSGEWE